MTTLANSLYDDALMDYRGDTQNDTPEWRQAHPFPTRQEWIDLHICTECGYPFSDHYESCPTADQMEDDR